MNSSPDPSPTTYLVISNVSKPNNIDRLLKVAAAFDIQHILVVGQKTYNFDTLARTPVLQDRLHVRRFAKWLELVVFLKQSSIRLVGIEIHESAVTPNQLARIPRLPTAFVPGNEASGLSDTQMKDVDVFVRIPQYGRGTASLNIYVATSIVLYNYCTLPRRQSVVS